VLIGIKTLSNYCLGILTSETTSRFVWFSSSFDCAGANDANVAPVAAANDVLKLAVCSLSLLLLYWFLTVRKLPECGSPVFTMVGTHNLTIGDFVDVGGPDIKAATFAVDAKEWRNWRASSAAMNGDKSTTFMRCLGGSI
jgi:hypothetical protein